MEENKLRAQRLKRATLQKRILLDKLKRKKEERSSLMRYLEMILWKDWEKELNSVKLNRNVLMPGVGAMWSVGPEVESGTGSSEGVWVVKGHSLRWSVQVSVKTAGEVAADAKLKLAKEFFEWLLEEAWQLKLSRDKDSLVTKFSGLNLNCDADDKVEVMMIDDTSKTDDNCRDNESKDDEAADIQEMAGGSDSEEAKDETDDNAEDGPSIFTALRSPTTQGASTRCKDCSFNDNIDNINNPIITSGKQPIPPVSMSMVESLLKIREILEMNYAKTQSILDSTLTPTHSHTLERCPTRRGGLCVPVLKLEPDGEIDDLPVKEGVHQEVEWDHVETKAEPLPEHYTETPAIPPHLPSPPPRPSGPPPGGTEGRQHIPTPPLLSIHCVGKRKRSPKKNRAGTASYMSEVRQYNDKGKYTPMPMFSCGGQVLSICGSSAGPQYQALSTTMAAPATPARQPSSARNITGAKEVRKAAKSRNKKRKYLLIKDDSKKNLKLASLDHLRMDRLENKIEQAALRISERVILRAGGGGRKPIHGSDGEDDEEGGGAHDQYKAGTANHPQVSPDIWGRRK